MIECVWGRGREGGGKYDRMCMGGGGEGEGG